MIVNNEQVLEIYTSVFTTSDGHRHEAEFVDGSVSGRGAWRFRDGRLLEGTWEGWDPSAGTHAALTADGAVLRAAQA